MASRAGHPLGQLAHVLGSLDDTAIFAVSVLPDSAGRNDSALAAVLDRLNESHTHGCLDIARISFSGFCPGAVLTCCLVLWKVERFWRLNSQDRWVMRMKL